jgi:hypothetical protein
MASGADVCESIKDAASADISDGGDTLSTVDTVGQCEDRSEMAEGELKENGKSPAEAIRYLKLYGYITDDLEDWGSNLANLPAVQFKVRVHTESHGHTVYLIECGLFWSGASEPGLTWSTTMRLAQLRRDLHDVIKAKLGVGYAVHFGTTPFAHHMGPPGTTDRLHAWFQTFSTCISAGLLPPALVAEVLQILDAPKLLAAKRRSAGKA